MQRQTISPSTIRTIQGNSFATAHMLQRQEWQQNAAATADRVRALRDAGLTNDVVLVTGFRRICAGLGGALVRLGSRLQSAGTPVAHPAR